jgi:hypothetical protein
MSSQRTVKASQWDSVLSVIRDGIMIVKNNRIQYIKRAYKRVFL